MKIMTCPVNGPRNISEFVWGGRREDRARPGRARCRLHDLSLLEDNTAGIVHEWWVHAPTNTWFIARRNTITDEILETMTPDTYFTRQKGETA